MSVLVCNARVLTLAKGSRPRRALNDQTADSSSDLSNAGGLGDLSIMPRGDVLIEGSIITAVAPQISTFKPADTTIDAAGRVLMPGFVDAHTHACWAGDRTDEWQRLLRGEPYLDILKSGGGIMSTVRSVRAASERELTQLLVERLGVMLRHGTTTVEVKSGYGLSTEHELKMLRAIRAAASSWAGTVVATALLGHAIDKDVPGFVEQTISETLPAVSREFPGITIDAYCEKTAWSLRDTVRLFEAARAAGHPVRVHADQFNSLGMVGEAVRLGALSVDHLEASSVEDLDLLAESGTFGVILPVCGLHTDGRYAKAREFIDGGGLLAVASNCNPGSAPSVSMPLAIALATRFCGLYASEAIAATTVNPATLLGLNDRGTIAPGQRADLVLLRHHDERMLAYELGGNPVDVTICGGNVVG